MRLKLLYIRQAYSSITKYKMFKAIYFLLAAVLAQMIAAGPAPPMENPINGENPEFGRGRGGRDRWTWCRCIIDRRGGRDRDGFEL